MPSKKAKLVPSSWHWSPSSSSSDKSNGSISASPDTSTSKSSSSSRDSNSSILSIVYSSPADVFKEDLEGENFYEILPSNPDKKQDENADKDERSDSPSLKPPVEIVQERLNGPKKFEKEENFQKKPFLRQQTLPPPQRSLSAGCSMTQKHHKGDSKRKNRYSLFVTPTQDAQNEQEEEERGAQKVMLGFFGRRKSRKDDFVESKNKRNKKRKKGEKDNKNSNRKAVSFAEDVEKGTPADARLQQHNNQLVLSEGGDSCVSCGDTFDSLSGRRRLIDSCGHARCYQCLFQSEECPACTGQQQQQQQDQIELRRGRRGLQNGVNLSSSSTDSPFRRVHQSPASRSFQSPLRPQQHQQLQNGRQHQHQLPQQGRVCSTPPACPRSRRFVPSNPHPSPTPSMGMMGIAGRPSWVQRHNRLLTGQANRPQTVNVDDATLSALMKSAEVRNRMPTEMRDKFDSMWGGSGGRNNNDKDDASSCHSSSSARLPLRPQHPLLPSANFARSSSLGPSSESNLQQMHRRAKQQAASLGRESGFQSTNSLNQTNNRGSSPAGSMASLQTGFASNQSFMSPLLRANNNNIDNKSVASSNNNRHQKDLRDEFAEFCHTRWPLKPLFFEVPKRDTDQQEEESFIGRQWLFAEVMEHLTSDLPTNRGVCVSGAGGTGKTAIALRLVQRSCFGKGAEVLADSPVRRLQRSPCSPCPFGESLQSVASHVVAYHFCQEDNRPTCSVPEFVHSLAAQLSQAPALRPYYNQLMTNYDLRSRLTLGYCLSQPDKALEEGILEPLRSVQGTDGVGSSPCVVVIDGIGSGNGDNDDDNSSNSSSNSSVAAFLSRHLDEFPNWIKFLVTVRSDKKGLRAVKGLPFHQISLDKSSVDERVRKDMTDYIGLRLNSSTSLMANVTPTSNGRSNNNSSNSSNSNSDGPQERFLQHLTDLCKGNFLHAKLTLELIERGHLVIKSGSFKVLPVSVWEVFLLELNLRFPSQSAFDKVSDILSVCLASLEPMTVPEIYQSVLALASGAGKRLTWPEFVQRFNQLSGLLVLRLDETVMFHHPLLREWLLRRAEGEASTARGKFLCDTTRGHLGIAVRLSRESSSSAERTLDVAHHLLRSNLYLGQSGDVTLLTDGRLTPADLQSAWLSQACSGDLSEALACPRNVFQPRVNASRLLLLAGASPVRPSDCLRGAPLLSLFCERGDEQMSALLLEFLAPPDQRNAEGATPLMFAAGAGRIGCARLLVAAGADISAADNEDRCAMVRAAAAGHLECVEYLAACDWQKEDDVSDKKGAIGMAEAAQQALVAAAQAGRFQVVEYLLDMSEVDVNASDTLLGDTALCAAAAAGQRRVCQILLRRGAAPAACNLKGTPPLSAAVRRGHWGVADLLLGEGAPAGLTDAAGRSALMVAAAEGHVGLVELLLQRGAELESTDSEGLTCLGWSCLKGQLSSVEFLLSSGADVNHADSKGRSPLDLAAYRGDPDVVQALLDAGAVVEHADINGMRPLDRAIGCRNAAAVQCFLRKGAKLGPATWAMANGKPDIMLLLLNKLLEDGNTLFKKGSLGDACHRYQYALRRLPTSFAGQHRPIFEQLQVHLLLNLSRCKRKQGCHQEAVQLADKVLNISPLSYEAFYAKAKAHRESGALRSALAALTDAARVAPQNRDVHRIILRIRAEIREAEDREEEERKRNNNNNKLSVNNEDSTSGVDSSTGGSSCGNFGSGNNMSEGKSVQSNKAKITAKNNISLASKSVAM